MDGFSGQGFSPVHRRCVALLAWAGVAGAFFTTAGLSCVPTPCGPVFPLPEADDAGPPVIEPGTMYPGAVSMQPGQTMQFAITRWACCYVPIVATRTPCVEWSIEPPEAGTIDGNGLLQLSQDVQPGQQVVVRAAFPEPDALDLSVTVTVYTTSSQPLVGSWLERSAVSCEDPQTPVAGVFEDLLFRADGTFALTWNPFEVYVDYWGTYQFDAATARLTMTITGGNYVPLSTDLEGTVESLPDGSLRLSDMYFGPSPGEASAVPTCGYVIERYP